MIGRLSADVLEKTRLYSSEIWIAFAFDVVRLEVSSKEMAVIGHLDSFSDSG